MDILLLFRHSTYYARVMFIYLSIYLSVYLSVHLYTHIDMCKHVEREREILSIREFTYAYVVYE